MNTGPQNPKSKIALYVSLAAFIAALFTGIVTLLVNMEALTLENADQYRLALQISAALAVLGVAVYAILEPEHVRTLLSGRQARYGSNAFITILAFIGIVIIANYLVETNNKIKEAATWDLTEGKLNTLSPELETAIKELPAPLNAIAFYSQVPVDSARDLFEKMEVASSGKFTFRFVDPVADPLAAKEYGVTGDGKIVLQMNGHTEIAAYADEGEILTAMNRLLNPEERTVYFLAGHGENDINGSGGEAFGRARETLEKKNITVKTLNLLAENKIPQDAKAIIIAGPSKPISPTEAGLLNGYALRGGSLVILENPLPLTDFGDAEDPLAAFLENDWGLRLRNDFVVDTSSQSIQVAVGAQIDPAHPVTSTMLLSTFMPLTRSIEMSAREGFTQTELMRTDSNSQSWGETDFTPLQGSAASVAFDPATDSIGPLVLVAASEKADGGKVLVIGSSTFATDEYFDAYGNGDLFVNSVTWAAGQGKSLDVTPKDPTIRTFTPPSQVGGLLVNIGAACLIPLIVIGLGIAVWVSRRRRG
ncbi:MAG: hypothetical protein HFACDABA_02716 [Anaerolineales bacterium]|nr:hypothetical protein [Anaerolineales bacterium]